MRVSVEEVSLLLSDVGAMFVWGEASLARLRQAVKCADLPPTGLGLGSLLNTAATLRSAVSLSVAFLGVRRAPEVAALRVPDVCVN